MTVTGNRRMKMPIESCLRTELEMGSRRTELTRLALMPIEDLESGLFVPIDESRFAELVQPEPALAAD